MKLRGYKSEKMLETDFWIKSRFGPAGWFKVQLQMLVKEFRVGFSRYFQFLFEDRWTDSLAFAHEVARL